MNTHLMLTEDKALKCPHCAGDYLHHVGLSIFERPVEDSPEIAIHISGADSPATNARNPSRRRDVLQIRFTCETCEDQPLVLNVAQHKGQTFIEWEAVT